MTYCKSCNAPVFWASTPSSRRIKLDSAAHKNGDWLVSFGAEISAKYVGSGPDQRRLEGTLHLIHECLGVV